MNKQYLITQANFLYNNYIEDLISNALSTAYNLGCEKLSYIQEQQLKELYKYYSRLSHIVPPENYREELTNKVAAIINPPKPFAYLTK